MDDCTNTVDNGAVPPVYTYSRACTISDAKALINTITVNSELMSSYSTHLLNGRSLMLSFRSFLHTMSALPNSATWDVQVARTFTRLNSVCVSLLGAETGSVKALNTYYNPTSIAGDTISNYLSVGDKRYSLFDRKGTSEHLQRLFECLGVSNSFQPVGINRNGFDSNQAIFAWDTEKLSGAAGSGTNLSHGQLLTVHMAGVGTSVANYPDRAYVALHHDVILELQSTGVSVHT